jgi:hypothetical protein
MKKLILILTIIFCFNTAHSQTKQLSSEVKDLKENSQTKLNTNLKDSLNDSNQVKETNSNRKDFLSEFKQLFNQPYVPEIDTVKIDTITNIDAASKCFTLSGELPNESIIGMGIVTGAGVALSTVAILSASTEALLLPLIIAPIGLIFGINYWVQTYQGNKYLVKAGRFLTIKGENGIEEIDDKLYYIKYINK